MVLMTQARCLPPGEFMQMNNPQYICHQLLWPQQEPQTPPTPPPHETVQDQQVGLAQAPMRLLLLPLVPVHVRFCTIPLRVKSVSPSPVELLQLSPAGLQIQMLWGRGHLFPMPDPRAGKPDVGLRTLTPVAEPLQGHPRWGVGVGGGEDKDLITFQVHPSYHLAVLSSLCL